MEPVHLAWGKDMPQDSGGQCRTFPSGPALSQCDHYCHIRPKASGGAHTRTGSILHMEILAGKPMEIQALVSWHGCVCRWNREGNRAGVIVCWRWERVIIGGSSSANILSPFPQSTYSGALWLLSRPWGSRGLPWDKETRHGVSAEGGGW